MALVSVHTSTSQISGHEPLNQNTVSQSENADPDLDRAFKLVELHDEVKMKHVQGQDRGLAQARMKVRMTLERLRNEGSI